MRFSIIIPAHNSATRIQPMLDSIKTQVCKDYELIVVCDACEDETEKVAKFYGARTFNIEAHNSAAGRNKGIDEARGDWVLFCDDDDYWTHPFALEHISKCIDAGIVTADMTQCAFIFGERGLQPAHGRIWPNVWSKIFRREGIGDTRFPLEDFPADDLGFVRRMLAKGVTIDWQPLLWYYYVYPRIGSIMWGIEHEGVR